MAATRDVSYENIKFLVDDSISSGTVSPASLFERSTLSVSDKMPYDENLKHIEETGGVFINNSQQALQDSSSSNSEFMYVDVSSPETGKNDDHINTNCYTSSVVEASYFAERNLGNENDLKKIKVDQSLEEADVLSNGLDSRSPTPHSSPPSDEMLIDSLSAEIFGNGSDTCCDLSVQGKNSEYKKSLEKEVHCPVNEFAISPLKESHDHSDDNDQCTSPILSYPDRRFFRKFHAGNATLKPGVLLKKEANKAAQIHKAGDAVKQVCKDFNGFRKCVPSTPTRFPRIHGLRDFLGPPALNVRNMRLLASPVGRKLDFDSAPQSSTPKPLRNLEAMNNSAPGPIETQSTPMDLFLPRRCNSEAITRIDKSRLHLWVNPFSPAGRNIISDIRNVQEKTMLKKKSDGSFIDDRECQDVSSPKKRKRSANSRYNSEFVELEEIGTGEHGCVYKCLNLINGLIYAIKISKHKVKRGYALETAQNELYAHGVLEHKNIVRNYSSWVEDGYVYIQNEYCNKGNLESYMKDHEVIGNKAKKLLYDIALALRYMHNMRLVHLDVKPGNIFVHEIETDINDGADSDSDDESDVNHVTFKLGDFGHIIHLDNLRNLEEGDCRYMARELLNEDKTDLTKADIFSLALSVYEAAGGGGGSELPKNGDEWHILRDGGLRKLPTLSDEMNTLLEKMTDPDLTKRPSAAEVCKTLTTDRKTEKLKEEIQSKIQKIAVLEAKQRERNCYIKQLKAQSLKFIQATDEIHAPRCTEKLPGKKK